jgi:hypothetical protein
MSELRKVKEGEWIKPPLVPYSYFMTCCRCGLTHRMQFKIDEAAQTFEMRGFTVPDPNAKPDHDMPEKWRS